MWEELAALGEAAADKFENDEPRPGDLDAPLPPSIAAYLAEWREGEDSSSSP